jgi:Protein of unknown function with PCYCGC motif
VKKKLSPKLVAMVALPLATFTISDPFVRPGRLAASQYLAPAPSSLPEATTICPAHSATASAFQQPTRPSVHYHDHPPTGPLSPTLDPSEFRDNPKAFVVYSIASRIPQVLYQEPCYCHCDQNEGHESLLDCYTRRHAVRCFACQSEAILIFEQYKTGKTPASIRAALERSEWTTVDVGRYAEAHYAEFLSSQPATTRQIGKAEKSNVAHR